MKNWGKVLCVLLCLIVIGGCGNKAKTEYDMDEFGEILNEVTESWKDEFAYLTDDEKNEKQIEIYNKYLKKYGLESGQEITIRGYYNDWPESKLFLLRAEKDIELETVLTGEFRGDGIKEMLREDEVVKVRGKLFTGGFVLLSECDLISPDISKRDKNK